MQSQWHQRGGHHDRRNLSGTRLAASELLWQSYQDKEADNPRTGDCPVPGNASNKLGLAYCPAKDWGSDTEVVKTTKTFGILIWLAALVTVLELIAYQACFIGPLMIFMAILQHQRIKRLKGE